MNFADVTVPSLLEPPSTEATQVCVLQVGYSVDDAAWLQARIGNAMQVLHCAPHAEAVEAALTSQVVMVVVQFDIRQDLESPVKLAQWLREHRPKLPVLGMGYANTPKVPLAALRGGAQDFMDMAGATDEQLKPFWALSMRGSAQAPGSTAAGAQRLGKTIALLGARPGMGVSTLAAHLSVALAQTLGASEPALAQQEMPVGLLDLGFPLRDGLMHLGLQSSFHMVDALQSMHRLDPALLAAALPRHRCGPVVLPWPAQAQAMRDVDPRSLSAMVQRLRAFFAWQVMDLGGLPAMEMVQAAAREADHVWMVCDQSVGGIVSMTEMLKALPPKPGGTPMCDGVVINRVLRGAGMAPEEIARRVAHPLRHVLPQRDLAMLQATSQGKLLSEVDASDVYCVQVRQMAAALHAGDVSVAPRNQGLLQRCQTWLQQAGGRA
ncbi:MAG: hypothetical protein RR100_00495 [Comamonas sp.]